MQDTIAYEVEVANTDDSGALSAPDGVTLSYLLSHFNADTSSKNFDWSLPKSASDWLSRLQRCAYISASNIASSVSEGHFFIPQLFDESKGSFSGAFKLCKAFPLAIGDNKVEFDNWIGSISRDTLVWACPIDSVGIVRKELVIKATAGELCLLKTRDLVFNYIGDFRNKGVTSESKLSYIELLKAKDLNSNRSNIQYVKPASAFLSHTWGDCFCDTIDSLLPDGDICYRSMVEPRISGSISSTILLALHVIVVLFVPFVGWIILPILGSRDRVLDHISKPRWWTPNAVVELGQKSFWIDIFCKNQHIINSDDTAIELASCVRRCGKTVLACCPWSDPSCLRRIWCQFEIHQTHVTNTQLAVCYPNVEKMKMDKSMYSWKELIKWLLRSCFIYNSIKIFDNAIDIVGSNLLGQAIYKLEVKNARATVEKDRDVILKQILEHFGGAEEGGFHVVDNLIQQEVVTGVVLALGGRADSGVVGERRPRQLSWSTRVAMYSFIFQAGITLAVLVKYNMIQLYILLFVTSFLILALSSTFFNMAAKTHQLICMLISANLIADKRMIVFVYERKIYLIICFLFLAGSLTLFGWTLVNMPIK